jgi:hypothetical protein
LEVVWLTRRRRGGRELAVEGEADRLRPWSTCALRQHAGGCRGRRGPFAGHGRGGEEVGGSFRALHRRPCPALWRQQRLLSFGALHLLDLR